MKLSSACLARRSILALNLMLPAALLGACTTPPPVILSANDCASLVPDDWSKGVPAPPLPPNKTAGEWVSAANAAVGQIDVANSRTRDAVVIVQKCEARDRAVADGLKPKPWWHLGIW